MSLDPTKEYFFGEQEQVTVLDPNKEYDFGADPRQLYREAPQTGFETGVIIGTELLGTVLGGVFTGGNPLGFAGGSALGNYLSQQYRIGRGLQDDVGLGELGAATVLGGVGVGRLAGMGAAGRTATRAAQGAGLAGAELTARTFIDEDRAPTQEEIATTLLFGGVFGGTLGAVEAKFLKDGSGADIKENMTRPEVEDALATKIQEDGGIDNASVGNPLLNASMVDTRRLQSINEKLNKINRSGRSGNQSRKLSAEKRALERKLAGDVLQGIENKLLKETEQAIGEIDNPVQGGILEQLKIDNQSRDNLRNAFNAKLASDNEIFTGVNPIVAKGNIGDTRRLREIDEELAKLNHLGSAGEQGDIVLGLRRPPTVNPNLTKLNDDAFDTVEIKARKELDKLEDNYFNQGGMEQNNLGLKRKLAAAQDAYSAVELEKFRRQIAGEEPWFIASEFRTLAGGTQNAETVFKLALLGETVKKRGIQQELFDELNANVGKDINAQEVFADQINKAKLATERFKKKNLTQQVPLSKQRKQLEKEKRALERKHNIVQNVLLGGAGVSAAASMFTEDEEASGSSLAMAGLLGFFGIKKGKKVTEALAKGTKKGQAKNASDEAIRAKGGTPTPDPEPIGRAAVEAERRQAASDRIPAKRIAPVDDIKRFYSRELIKQLEETNDPYIRNIIVAELSERASRDTPKGRALRNKLFKIVTFNKEISDETFNALNRVRDAPAGIQKTNPNVRGVSQAKNAELVQLAKNGDPEALKELRKRAAKNPKTKKLVEREGLITGLLTTGTGAIALLEMMEDEDDSVSRASLGGFELLTALALSAFGYRQAKKYIKSAEFKKAKAQIKANPSAAEHTSTKQARVAQDADRIYKLPGKTGKIIKDVRDILGDVLAPLSREAKNIGPFVAKAFREVDLKGLKRKSQFKKAAQPFILSVNKLLKNDKAALEKFNDDLNTGNFDGIREMLDKKNVMHKFGKEFKDTLDTLTAIRAYGREEGGIEVGFRENYFPRQVLDYPSLRKFLDSDPDAREATTSIDQAFAKYADEHKISVDNLTNQERAEITARTLAGRVKSSGPGNTKTRSINDVELYQKVKGGYAKPLDALNNYIESMVDAVEKRKFLGQVKSKNAPNVGMEGSFDTNPLADLGMRADISDTLADKVAKNMLKGQKYSEQDIQKLRSLIQSRFGGVPVSPAIQGLKNANYIQVMTNFGSAITQFGDLGFSAHFNGMDNTFKSLFNRKDVYNFTDSIGLSGKDYDTTSSNAFLSKTLDTLFTATGLKKIDQLGKNTFMNAAWRKYHKIAKKDTKGLSDELTPYFGRERADQISIAARDNAPNSKFVPLEVEELVFHKLLDVAPATASEMPALYTRMGKGRIFYMLKSFTIKQLDAYREAGADEIFRGISKYNAATTGNERLAAAKQAGKGLAKLTQLAAIFAAANASTDVIKDTLAGRPTKKDELVENNIWKLFGLNRYIYYNAKREGGAKALVELMLPPTAVFDRAWTDISSTLSGEEYKGAMLQGTPLDLIYWRYLGGVDKVKNMQ